jgi:hypothetical protein
LALEPIKLRIIKMHSPSFTFGKRSVERADSPVGAAGAQVGLR